MKPHFEFTFFPTHLGVVKRFERRLEEKDEIRDEIKNILRLSGVTPTKIFIKKLSEGTGKKDSWLDGFRYKKYKWEIAGKKKNEDNAWANNFEIYLLFSRTRDGFLFSTKTNDNTKLIGKNLYNRLLSSIGKRGAIPFNQITRAGTI